MVLLGLLIDGNDKKLYTRTMPREQRWYLLRQDTEKKKAFRTDRRHHACKTGIFSAYYRISTKVRGKSPNASGSPQPCLVQTLRWHPVNYAVLVRDHRAFQCPARLGKAPSQYQ
jgi:hypothetical protein